MIKENVNDFLEKIETDDVRKEFLTSEELKKLAATPCDIPVLKQASLFSCLTGLRISDILNLAWDVSVSAMLPCPLLFIIIPLPPNQNQ